LRDSGGETEGNRDGKIVGIGVGENVSDCDVGCGGNEGLQVDFGAKEDGEKVEEVDCGIEGARDGKIEGGKVGTNVGLTDNRQDGAVDGIFDCEVGHDDGGNEGRKDGGTEGASDGKEGGRVGTNVGLTDNRQDGVFD